MKKMQKTLQIILIPIVGGIAGFAIGVVRHNHNPQTIPLLASIIRGILTGAIISFSLFMLEFQIFPLFLKKTRFLVTLIIKTFSYTIICVGVFILLAFAFRFYIPMELQLEFTLNSTLISLGIFLCIVYFISIHKLLGTRVIFSMMTGRYYSPREEFKIIMFLDICGSTAIAEKIGHLEFHKFLNDFFFDINDAIINSGGEIYKYVGDEVIVVWNWYPQKKKSNENSVKCFITIRKIIKQRETFYKNKYNIIPGFRAGLHCGKVVTGEMGDSKKEISFIGDTVNTASRIQAECKSLNKNILLSHDLAESLPQAWPPLENMGRIKLRGKENEIKLYSIKEDGINL